MVFGFRAAMFARIKLRRPIGSVSFLSIFSFLKILFFKSNDNLFSVCFYFFVFENLFLLVCAYGFRFSGCDVRTH